MKTAAAYIRVSTDMQTELSPDSQLHMIRQYAEQHDILLPNCYIFSDEGISGRKADKRPGFQSMIATAKQKPTPFDVILVWKFSRFARSREDSIVYKSMLRKQCNIEVVSISEPMGEDKTSILMESMLEAMDEYYSINLAEEVRRGMEEKFRRGGVVVAPPLGYIIKDGKYEIEESQAAIIRKIFSDFLDGKGIRTIALDLNAMGFRTKRGNKFDNRNIEYIITNPMYIGKLRYSPNHKCTTAHKYVPSADTIEIEGTHEHIIDNAAFEEAQKLMAEIKSRYVKYYRQRAEGETEYYFRGIVRCSDCGATLTQSAKGQGMQCHNFARGQCDVSHYISFNKLKSAVISSMTDDAEGNTDLKYISKPKVSGSQSLDEILQEQISKEEKRLERIRAAYEDGIDTLEEYKANKTKILQNIDMLKSKLSDSAARAPKQIDLSAYRHKIVEALEILKVPDISPSEFNETLILLVDRIIFDRKKSRIQIYYKI